MHLASQQGATSVFEPDAIGSSTSRDIQPDNAHSVQRVPDLDVGRSPPAERHHPAALDGGKRLSSLDLAKIRLSVNEKNLRNITTLGLLNHGIDVDELFSKALGQQRPDGRLA